MVVTPATRGRRGPISAWENGTQERHQQGNGHPDTSKRRTRPKLRMDSEIEQWPCCHCCAQHNRNKGSPDGDGLRVMDG
eukprot:scaffold6362_cov378-Prasinococcus_capsulatus_cf.AAC.6